jgi:O-antigen ligase
MTAPAIRRRLEDPAIAVRRREEVSGAKTGFVSNPFAGVEWSMAFVAFCAYIFAIVSYRLPIGTSAMVAALLTLPLEKKELRLPPITLMAFALVGWALLGMTTTKYPDAVLDSVTEFAKVCAVLFVAVNVLTTRARFRAFIVFTTVVFCAYPLRGTLFAYFIYGGAVGGRAAWNYIYSNPNDLAGLCLLQLAVGLGALAVEQRPWVKNGIRVGVGLLVLVIVLTGSRGAIIGLAAFGIIGGRKYFRDVRKILSVLAIIVLVVLVVPDTTWKRFSTIENAMSTDPNLLDPEMADFDARADQGSTVQRLAIWDVARTIVSENLWMGVGLGAYPEEHNIVSRRPEFNPTARGKRDTHSTYLNVLAETGLVGFLLFASMIILSLRKSYKARKRMEKRAPAMALQLFNMEVGLYGYLVAAVWGSYGAMIATYIHLVLMNIAASLLEEDAENGMNRVRGQKFIPAAAPKAARKAGAGA